MATIGGVPRYAGGYIVTFEELRDNLYEVVSKRRAAMLAFERFDRHRHVELAIGECRRRRGINLPVLAPKTAGI